MHQLKKWLSPTNNDEFFILMARLYFSVWWEFGAACQRIRHVTSSVRSLFRLNNRQQWHWWDDRSFGSGNWTCPDHSSVDSSFMGLLTSTFNGIWLSPELLSRLMCFYWSEFNQWMNEYNNTRQLHQYLNSRLTINYCQSFLFKIINNLNIH